jgi:hypothetical protein
MNKSINELELSTQKLTNTYVSTYIFMTEAALHIIGERMNTSNVLQQPVVYTWELNLFLTPQTNLKCKNQKCKVLE